MPNTTTSKWLAELKPFSGQLSLDADSLNVNFRAGIDPSGEFVFEFEPIPLNERSKFIILGWDRDKVEFTHFSLTGTTPDQIRFETSDLMFTTLGKISDSSGTRMAPNASCSKATLTYKLKEPIENPALNVRIKGFESFGSQHATCALGQIRIAGQRDIEDANTVTGSIGIQADAVLPDIVQWHDAADRLLEHVRRVMSFASSSMLRAPITEFFHKDTVVVTAWSQSKTAISGFPIFHPLDHDEIFQAAVRSFFNPPVVVKQLPFAMEWFAMDAIYNEVRLVAVMTALENLINSNLSDTDTLIMPVRAFEKTRRVLRGVIRTCVAKWPAGSEEVATELNEKLTELNRRSFLRKLNLLAQRWNVPLDGITEDMLQAAKRARDRVVHRGEYYEGTPDDDAGLWHHVTVIREVAARFLLAAIGFKGSYYSYIGGYHAVTFPPTLSRNAQLLGSSYESS